MAGLTICMRGVLDPAHVILRCDFTTLEASDNKAASMPASSKLRLLIYPCAKAIAF